MQKEVPLTIKRRTDGGCLAIPVLLSPVDIQDAPFAFLTAFPSGARPVSEWKHRDDAWDDVIGAIRRAVRILPTLIEFTHDKPASNKK